MDSGPGDETLLAAVAGRDMGAFRTLYEPHAGWLAIRLARRCNDRDLVRAEANYVNQVDHRWYGHNYERTGETSVAVISNSMEIR